jgi:cytosine deaminase
VPTHALLVVAEREFFEKLRDKDIMRLGFLMAEKGYSEGGCYIGGVIRDNNSGLIVGKGHNEMVQKQVLSIHGETAAVNDAGLGVDFSQTTMLTTLSPCLDMCTPTICRLEFARVVVGDVTNVDEFNRTEMQKRIESRGIKVEILEDPEGVARYLNYRHERPGQDWQDWKHLKKARQEVPGYEPPRR